MSVMSVCYVLCLSQRESYSEVETLINRQKLRLFFIKFIDVINDSGEATQAEDLIMS